MTVLFSVHYAQFCNIVWHLCSKIEVKLSVIFLFADDHVSAIFPQALKQSSMLLIPGSSRAKGCIRKLAGSLNYLAAATTY